MDADKSTSVKKKSMCTNVYVPPPARKLSESKPNTCERSTTSRSNAYDGSKACNDSSKLFLNDNERVYSIEWTKHRQRTKKKQNKTKSKTTVEKCNITTESIDELSSEISSDNKDVKLKTDTTSAIDCVVQSDADLSAKNIDEKISNDPIQFEIDNSIQNIDTIKLNDELEEIVSTDDGTSEIVTFNTLNNCKLDSNVNENSSSDLQDWESLYDETVVDDKFKQLINETKRKQIKAEEKFEKEDVENRGSILEIYGFSKDLKTNDLVTILSAYTTRGLKLSWVDDTHALAIFPSPSLADEVLACELPLIKTRPLIQGTQASQDKARTLVLPSTLRPKTCSAMARRLVSGALGLKVSITPEAREAEREILRKAREEKKLAAKQRDAAWQGIFDVPKTDA